VDKNAWIDDDHPSSDPYFFFFKYTIQSNTSIELPKIANDARINPELGYFFKTKQNPPALCESCQPGHDFLWSTGGKKKKKKKKARAWRFSPSLTSSSRRNPLSPLSFHSLSASGVLFSPSVRAVRDLYESLPLWLGDSAPRIRPGCETVVVNGGPFSPDQTSLSTEH
jgi:hypothetical protein